LIIVNYSLQKTASEAKPMRFFVVFNNLYCNPRENDLALIHPGGTHRLKSRKLTARLIRLLKYQKSDSRVFDRLGKELSGITPAVINAIITGGPLPDAVASRALANIRSRMMASEPDDRTVPIPDPIACQWLKVWLKRKRRSDKQEDNLVEEYNVKNPTAYNCGALMAVYAAIQKAAMPDVNAGVIQRYYNSACQTPALVIGYLSKLSNYHLDKLNNDRLAGWYRKKLQEIYSAMGREIPVTLTLEEQSYFALGYYQMSADLFKKKDKDTNNKEDN
jgi:CRISPR-associated protein Csd1